MKSGLFFFIALSVSVLAINNKESENIINSASYGDKVISESPLGEELQKKKINNFNDAVLLNWYLHFASLNDRGGDYTATQKKLLHLKQIEETNSTTQTSNKKELVSVKGFCLIQENIAIGKQPAALRSECETNIGSITMFGDLVNVNEKASLIVDPKYIERKGYRFKVESAVVTNESKTSYNIATFVNDRKIAEIGYSSLGVSADELKATTNEYLRVLEESKRKQNVEYVEVGSEGGDKYIYPIQTQNTEKPDPLDYLLKAGINIGASSIKTTADIFKKDLPYLYEVAGKTKIWIDLQVEKQGILVK
ncbi:hypothetical protein CCZ01_09345 [Helicobacter monodelphidis]|uniref:hypothetical protein n=1 Tax=Helicobacter sp. 15-1451 TaxID=2004995 RepID=UPI000DCE414E|nr:hypothetical protein [Helicobacter sp. 15-1451]RAX56489.1 hypothetical protein CCZ01_09345 [Helicobacter sp. 15-1451]